MNRPPFEIGHIKIDNVTFDEAVEKIISLAREHRSKYIVTPNADHIVRLQEDSKFREIYQGASLTVADGMPLIWVSKLLGNPLKERVTGADLLPRLCQEAAQRGLSIYLLGGAEGVPEQAANNLKARYPTLNIAGLYSPPFGFEKDFHECQYIVDQINRCEPDILFVGLGSPKQELYMANYQKFLRVGVMLGIGASIAFAAGTEKRAPFIMQKYGFEWLYRLLQDPRRLTQRYLKDLAFLGIAYRSWRKK